MSFHVLMFLQRAHTGLFFIVNTLSNISVVVIVPPSVCVSHRGFEGLALFFLFFKLLVRLSVHSSCQLCIPEGNNVPLLKPFASG